MNHAVFNKKATEFLADLIQAYPEIEQFKTLKGAFTLLKNVSEDTPLKMFQRNVLSKYSKEIEERDEHFFLQRDDYDSDIIQVTTHVEYWRDFITNLKSLWQSMSPENKEAIWNHLNFLTVIARQIQNTSEH